MTLGLIPYLVAITVLQVAQYQAFSMLDDGTAAFFALIALQFAKLPVAAARARDLGWDGDEAVIAVVPFANIALYMRLLARRPSDEERAARSKVHAGESSAYALMAWGASHAPRAMLVGGVAWVLVCLLDTAAVLGMESLAEPGRYSPSTLELLRQGAKGASLLLGLLTLLQFRAMRSAQIKNPTRASWFPTIFLFASLLTWGGAAAAGGAGTAAAPAQMQMIGSILFATATLSFWAVTSTWAACVSHLAARALLSGEPVHFGMWGESARRVIELSGAHAAVRYLVSIGFQVFFVPGALYASRYALVDQVGWEEEGSALGRAGALSKGHRQRVFRALMIAGVPFAYGSLVISVLVLGSPARLVEMMQNPYVLPVQWQALVSALFGVAALVFELGATRMYFERTGQLTDGRLVRETAATAVSDPS